MILEKTNVIPVFDSSNFTPYDFGTDTAGAFGTNTIVNPYTINASSNIIYSGTGIIYLKLLANKKYEFKELESVNLGRIIKYSDVDVSGLSYSGDSKIGDGEPEYSEIPKYGGIIQSTVDCILEMHVDIASGPAGYYGDLPADDGSFSVQVTDFDYYFFESLATEVVANPLSIPSTGVRENTWNIEAGTGETSLVLGGEFDYSALRIMSTIDTVCSLFIENNADRTERSTLYINLTANEPMDIVVANSIISVVVIKDPNIFNIDTKVYAIPETDYIRHASLIPSAYQFGLNISRDTGEPVSQYNVRVLKTLSISPDNAVKKLMCDDTIFGRVARVLYFFRNTTEYLKDNDTYIDPIGYNDPDAFRLLIINAFGKMTTIGDANTLAIIITYGYMMNIYPYLNIDEVSKLRRFNSDDTVYNDQLETIHHLFITLAMSIKNRDAALLKSQEDWDNGLLPGTRPTKQYSDDKYMTIKEDRLKSIDIDQLTLTLGLNDVSTIAISRILDNTDIIYATHTRSANPEEVTWLYTDCEGNINEP